ncbi:hypothetical protein EVAR_47002_1 [Eumeta japonica]|uniref:Uncharacterized protein n=1 Tax=Eumeta variegata TaxID=151549 RepID=A0A4C1X9A5_EUMVA|nr:hypothetical protein EVAR_47002_1 [Eumeta japonica]
MKHHARRLFITGLENPSAVVSISVINQSQEQSQYRLPSTAVDNKNIDVVRRMIETDSRALSLSWRSQVVPLSLLYYLRNKDIFDLIWFSSGNHERRSMTQPPTRWANVRLVCHRLLSVVQHRMSWRILNPKCSLCPAVGGTSGDFQMDKISCVRVTDMLTQAMPKLLNARISDFRPFTPARRAPALLTIAVTCAVTMSSTNGSKCPPIH